MEHRSAPDTRPSSAGAGRPLHALLADIATRSDFREARHRFKETVLDLSGVGDRRDIIEIGGGRSPMLSEAEAAARALTYTVNDVSERELSMAPGYARRARFDVATADAGEIAPHLGRYDLAFSCMVMEHVPDYRQAYRNLAAILRPGGVSIAYHPVLFSVPFVVNKLLPERLTARLLKALMPHRHDGGVPKFPAHYDGCRISPAVVERIRACGFDEAYQFPFFGHAYYRRLPGLRTVHAALTRRIAAADVGLFSTFCYTVAVKAPIAGTRDEPNGGAT